ncbi:MAG: BACON domain-containing protein [Bacteroidales bacterium]|nr:BACON domain-containing protein [Bacteroidales bacterium]
MKRIITFIFICASILSCQKEEGMGKVEVESDVIYLPAAAGTRHVLVDATTEWRLEYDTSTPWMSTDLHGGKVNRKYFTVSFLDNPYASARTCSIRVFTSDGNDTKEITVIQKRRPSVIQFETEELEVECWAGTYSVAFTDNIIDRQDIKFSTDSDWITLYPYSDDGDVVEFYIDRLPSVVESHRTGHVYVTCEVEDEGTVTDVLTVRQLAGTNE